MTPLACEFAWNEARRLLGTAGKTWPEAFDSHDIAGLSEYQESTALGLVDSLRDWPASGGWSWRESSLAGTFHVDTRADAVASFPVWKIGNEVHFLLVRPQGKPATEQLVARPLFTAGEIRQFFAALGKEPPRLLAAWIAASPSFSICP